MSDFVNYTKQSVELPQGGRDLIDLLRSGRGSLPMLCAPRRRDHDLDARIAPVLSMSGDYGLLSILSFDLESALFIKRMK